MHTLARKVRFSINPFLKEDLMGHNSFASKPAGTGLAIFLEITVTIKGPLGTDSGFVINIVEIDKQVRKHVVPVFAKFIREKYKNQSHISTFDTAKLLTASWESLADKFQKAKLVKLNLALNPFRNIAIDNGDSKMIYFSEKFEFAAMHKLYNKKLTEKENSKLFGKCANPTGHGHNYTIEVTIAAELDAKLETGKFEKTVDKKLIELLDHKNLNADVEYFKNVNPTVENIAVFAWETLNKQFKNTPMHCVTVWETNKTSCTYYGPQSHGN